jgi:hypothetical protein
MSMQL